LRAASASRIGGRIFVGLLRSHQISIGAIGTLFLFEDFSFQAGALVAGGIA